MPFNKLIAHGQKQSRFLNSEFVCGSETEWKAHMQNKTEQMKLENYISQMKRERIVIEKCFAVNERFIRSRSALLLKRRTSLPDLTLRRVVTDLSTRRRKSYARHTDLNCQAGSAEQDTNLSLHFLKDGIQSGTDIHASEVNKIQDGSVPDLNKEFLYNTMKRQNSGIGEVTDKCQRNMYRLNKHYIKRDRYLNSKLKPMLPRSVSSQDLLHSQSHKYQSNSEEIYHYINNRRKLSVQTTQTLIQDKVLDFVNHQLDFNLKHPISKIHSTDGFKETKNNPVLGKYAARVPRSEMVEHAMKELNISSKEVTESVKSRVCVPARRMYGLHVTGLQMTPKWK